MWCQLPPVLLYISFVPLQLQQLVCLFKADINSQFWTVNCFFVFFHTGKNRVGVWERVWDWHRCCGSLSKWLAPFGSPVGWLVCGSACGAIEPPPDILVLYYFFFENASKCIFKYSAGGKVNPDWRLCPSSLSRLSSSLPLLLSFCRLPKHRRPGGQGKLRPAGPDPGSALDQREHCGLWWRPSAHHRLWLRCWRLLRQPADPVTLLRGQPLEQLHQG